MPLLLLLALQIPAADPDIDAVVNKAMRQSVPGCAVVIVRDDKVIYCKGHGWRIKGGTVPVSPDTLFPISSCTKAFTSAAIALLVEEGKLDWDDPVRKHLPWFRLSDPLVEDAVTLRDLMCHRTGIGQHELLWHYAPWGPEEAVRRLRYLPLSKPFRTTLQYQSTTFAAAGLVAAEASKTSWSDLVRKRLLIPLEMKSTCTSFPDALKTGDLADPHRDTIWGSSAVPRSDPDHADPAISIYTSARDLGTWLRFHLAEGKPLLKSQLSETHTPQMVTRLSPEQKKAFPNTNEVSYAMGWAVHDYRGLKLVSHGGAIDGYRVHITMVPEKKLGIAVLCNLEHSTMPLALANTLVDHLLGFPKREWAKLLDLPRFEKGVFPTGLERHENTSPSHEMIAYVGDYEHPAYGIVQLRVKVRLFEEVIYWKWRDEEVPLRHYHHDSFALSSDYVHYARVTFSTNAAGHIDGFRVTGRLGGVEFRKLRSKPK